MLTSLAAATDRAIRLRLDRTVREPVAAIILLRGAWHTRSTFQRVRLRRTRSPLGRSRVTARNHSHCTADRWIQHQAAHSAADA